jgi:hypothetical protein
MRKLIALVALAAGAACSLNTDTSTGPLAGDLAGVYSLQTIDGTALPFTIVAKDTTVLIDTDVLTLGANGAWAEAVQYRQTVGTAATTAESFNLSGIWERVGNSVTFRTASGLLYVGTATDTTLLLSDSRNAYVFKR